MCNFKPSIATPIIFAFMLAGPIYDLLVRRKIHSAYLVGLVVIMVTGPPLRLAFGKTALWHHLFARAVGLPGRGHNAIGQPVTQKAYSRLPMRHRELSR